jgi:hypothetical protein
VFDKLLLSGLTEGEAVNPQCFQEAFQSLHFLTEGEAGDTPSILCSSVFVCQ